MSSSFVISGQPFEDGGAFAGYSFSNFDSVKDSAGDSSPVIDGAPYNAGEDVFFSQAAVESPFLPPIYSAAVFSPEQNGKGVDGGFGASDGPILPPPTDMVAEEGFALREWRMQNAIQLEEKEKEMRSQIIEEAEEYKVEFYRKREVDVEKNKASNREREKPKPPPSETKKDAKTGTPDGASTSSNPPKVVPVATPEAVAAA